MQSSITNKISKARLVNRLQLSSEVTELRFLMIHPTEIEFKPGQYIAILIDPKTRRQYSISTSPYKSKSEFEIIYDNKPQGIGVTFLNNLVIGAEINFIGGIGHFILPEIINENNYFISTGTGFGSLKSMIETIIFSDKYNHKLIKIHNIFGTRYSENVIYYEQISKYLLDGEITEYKVYISKDEITEGNIFMSGRVTNYFKLGNFDLNGNYFICGNGEMIKSVEEILRKSGVNQSQIFYEKFF